MDDMNDMDIDALKRDLTDYYAMGACIVAPAMIEEAFHLRTDSDDEVMRKARDAGFEMEKYRRGQEDAP